MKNASPIIWHDARDTARMQGLIILWAYATESNEDDAAELKKVWEQWNDLRPAYMFQEFIAKEQFQRKVWAVLTPEQKAQLIAGERFARMARKEVQGAFNLFTLTERDAIRELVLAGYNVTPELTKRSATFQAELRAQILEKYRENAGDLLRIMGEIKFD